MKKIVGYLIISLILFTPNIVKAACEYEEQNRLNALASNVKINYSSYKVDKEINFINEANEAATQVVPVKALRLNINNITEDLYVIISNNLNSNKTTYHFSDAASGVITMDAVDSYHVTEYKIDVYTTNDSCAKPLLRTISFTMPKVNVYNDYGICESAKGFYLCQEFLTADYDVSEVDFLKKAEEYIAKLNKKDTDNDDKDDNFFTKIINFVVEYWYFFVGGITVIGVTVGTIIIVKRRRRII